jgi:CheY-like chemotaxis protein
MGSRSKRLLFLDDNADFLAIVQTILGGIAAENWEIYTAQNAGMALQIVQEKQIDLVVVDMHMPVVNGLEFLSLLSRKHPNVPKAVMTSDATEANRAACLSRGAEAFLQKPALPQDWRDTYAALNDLARSPSEEGFRGVLRRVGLQDVLQMECLSRNSAILEIKTKTIHGLIYIEEGQIVHAEAGQRSGEEAFNYLMTLSGGEFNLKPFTQPRQRTIEGQWEFLLMEAARKRDESREAESPSEPEPPRTAARQLPDPFSSPQTQFIVKQPPPKPEQSRPDIAEFIILSSQGDVLYQWQCEDINGRIRFLEFLSQRARQVSQGMTLGEFERFEVHGSKSRVIAHVDADHAFFVRTDLTAIVGEPSFA